MAVLSKLLKTAAKTGKDVVEEADITRKAKIEANRREANINRFGYDPNESKTLPDTSYRFQHQPRSDGARLDDMTGGGEYFPDDIYSSKGLSYYGDPKNKFDVESFNVIQSVKGKPNDEVTIYRAVPKDEKIKDINEGDFVTLSKDYAELHAKSGYGVGGNESGKIISKKVKVKDLRSDGNDLNEFGYFPEKEKIKVFQGRSKKGTEDFMNPTDFYGDESVSFGTTDLDTADQFANKQTSTYPYRAKDGSEGPTKKTLIPGDVAELEFDIKNPMVVNRKSIGFSRDNEKAMIAEAKEKGHDGVKIIYDGSDKIDYVAFNKKQVKIVNKSLYPEREYPYSPTGAEKEQIMREKELRLAPPLEIGRSEEALKGTFLRNYTARDAEIMDILSENSTAGSSKADKLINKKVKENEKVAVRLNLNSKLDQKGLNVPSNKLQTVHKNNFNGKALSYKPYATVENAVFNVNQKGRVAIASKIKGLDVPEAKSKFPAMSVDGNYNSTRNVLEEMGDDVVEIGFNPANTHLFIDLKTGQAVKSAEVATVIGDRVYAKGVVYWRKKDAPVNLDASDGTPISSEVRYKFKKGGISMKKQMEMFQEGGLEQDGGTVDPVSGNEVPVGSSQEEVRDDIDAKLSEGEFVFPADVVRYIGLEKLMQLRQEAKAGLKKMEAMGQMGNSEEATLPDDIPFSPEDITVEDDDGNEGELEMNVGGVVYQPSQVGSQFNIAPRQQDPSGAMGYGYVPPVQQTGYLPSFAMQSQQPQQYTGFQSLVPMPTQKFENVSYINKTTGETMVIPHVGGNPVFQPPEGFVPITAGEEAPKEETKVDETIDTSVPTATVTKPYDKEGDATSPENMRKAEEERNRSYENMVESAIKQSGISNPSLEDVTKFIKDGNVKANLFGFEFGIPGLTFREEDIEKAYNKKVDLVKDTATGKFSGSDQIDRVGPDLKTTFTSAFKKKEDEDKDADATEELKETLSKLDAGYKEQQEIDKEKADALLAQQQAAAKKYLQQLENKRAEAEENRKKAKEEKTFKDFKESQKKVSGYAPDFKKGGIASKPKKMKRGGLASKK